MRMCDGEEIVTVAEAAVLLSRSTKTVRRYMKTGSLERRRVPGDRRHYVTCASVTAVRDRGGEAMWPMLVALARRVGELEYEVEKLGEVTQGNQVTDAEFAPHNRSAPLNALVAM